MVLTLSPTGGGSLRPPLAEIRIAPKRMHSLIQNFLTKFEFQSFTPTPLGGGTKEMKF